MVALSDLYRDGELSPSNSTYGKLSLGGDDAHLARRNHPIANVVATTKTKNMVTALNEGSGEEIIKFRHQEWDGKSTKCVGGSE